MATRIREKALKRAENRDRRPKAHARYVRISSRKVKVVLDLIRGKSVAEASAILQFTPRSAAPLVAKVLDSAIANAENNMELNRDSLVVAECFANQGPTLKRFQPVSHGRAHSILKRSSHITVVLDKAK
jgi:ribosomal protein L22, bacterial type